MENAMAPLVVPGLSVRLVGVPATTEQVVCDECGATGLWSSNNGRIRHSKRCDSQPQLLSRCEAPVASGELLPLTASQRLAIRDGAISAVLSDDEIVARVRRGEVSVSDAMNRDF
jgi:hypothetical protein